MKVLGLTGGIGMGKSTSAQLLRERSIPVVDTDDLAREVVEPGQPALAQIQGAFGPAIVDAQGRLSRNELARVVFADPEARRVLEGILHPRIRALWHARMEQWRSESHSVAVVVIPLLFETGAEKELDLVLCVACLASTQRQRLLARGWEEREIEQRIQAQLSIDQKISKSDFMIWTEPPGTEVHAQQLDRILERLKNS